MRIKARPCCNHYWITPRSHITYELYRDITSDKGCEVMECFDGKIVTVEEYNGEYPSFVNPTIIIFKRPLIGNDS